MMPKLEHAQNQCREGQGKCGLWAGLIFHKVVAVTHPNCKFDMNFYWNQSKKLVI